MDQRFFPHNPLDCMRCAGDFVCQQCVHARANQTVTTDCGATLIVSPAAIHTQWQTEIAKHTHPGAGFCCSILFAHGQLHAMKPSLPMTLLVVSWKLIGMVQNSVGGLPR